MLWDNGMLSVLIRIASMLRFYWVHTTYMFMIKILFAWNGYLFSVFLSFQKNFLGAKNWDWNSHGKRAESYLLTFAPSEDSYQPESSLHVHVQRHNNFWWFPPPPSHPLKKNSSLTVQIYFCIKIIRKVLWKVSMWVYECNYLCSRQTSTTTNATVVKMKNTVVPIWKKRRGC